MFVFFFFKQKTAYEMRISDWSSDVCSSDLRCVKGCPGMLATFSANRRSKAHDPIHPFRRVGDRRADLRHIIAAGADCQRGPRFSSDVIGADLGWPDIRLECASWFVGGDRKSTRLNSSH